MIKPYKPNRQPDANQLLLAIDGSDHSKAAVELLQSLHLLEGSRVNAVAVLIPREASSKSWALMDALDQTREMLQGQCYVETTLLTGNPAEELINFASRHRPDLIVLGARGMRSTLGILLGGVAQQIVEYVCCPVLVIRTPFRGLERIGLCTDGSYHSQRALEYLYGFPLPPTIDLRVLHILPPVDINNLIATSWVGRPEILSAAPIPEINDNLQKQAEKEERRGKEILAKAVDELGKKYQRITPVLLRGDAATELIHYIKAEKLDLIAAGSRGLSQVESWLLGSVSRKLVHYAGCSTLIVKLGGNGKSNRVG